jgi:hypothetical protein
MIWVFVHRLGTVIPDAKVNYFFIDCHLRRYIFEVPPGCNELEDTQIIGGLSPLTKSDAVKRC